MLRLHRLGLASAVAGSLLAVAPSSYEPFLLAKLAALSAGLVLAWIGLLGSGLRRTAFDAPLAALWAAMLLSAAASTDRPTAVFGFYPQLFHGLLPLGLCAALYYAVASAPDDGSDEPVWTATLAAAAAVSLYGIWQRLAGDPLLNVPLVEGYRIVSTIGNPVMLGACLVPIIPLALHRALRGGSLLAPAALAAAACALLLTWARGAWLSSAAATLLYLHLTGRLRLKLGARHWIAAALVAATLLAAFEVRFAKGKSDSMRLEVLKSAWTMVEARPLLGWGPDNYLAAFRAHKTDGFLRAAGRELDAHPSAHNDLIQAAVTLGAPGLAAYAWLLWAVFLRLRRLSSQDATGGVAALAAALLGLFLQAKVNPLPTPALALAAAMLGVVGREPRAVPLKPLAGRAVCALAALFCAGAALLWGRWLAADREFGRGVLIVNATTLADKARMDGVSALRRANELSPWVLDYALRRMDVIVQAAGSAPREQGRQLLDKALAIADQNVSLHPGSATARESRATVLVLMTLLGTGRLPEAFAEIKAASALDPTSLSVMRRRIEIARALRDREDMDRTLAEYRRVVGLTGENPVWEPLLR